MLRTTDHTLIARNEAACHSQSLGNLHERNGHALLLGVDIYKLSMPYVENNLPEKVPGIFKPAEELLNKYPVDEWCMETAKPTTQPWYTIQDQAYKKAKDASESISRTLLVPQVLAIPETSCFDFVGGSFFPGESGGNPGESRRETFIDTFGERG